MTKVLSAWNFRARECRSELVRTMPSAAENLKEEAVRSEAMVTGYAVPGGGCCDDSAWKAVRLWRCFICKYCGVVPSRHIVPASPIRGLRPRLPKSYAFVVPSRHIVPASPIRGLRPWLPKSYAFVVPSRHLSYHSTTRSV